MANNILEKEKKLLMRGKLPYCISEYRIESPMKSLWFWHTHRKIDQ